MRETECYPVIILLVPPIYCRSRRWLAACSVDNSSKWKKEKKGNNLDVRLELASPLYFVIEWELVNEGENHRGCCWLAVGIDVVDADW